MRSMKAMMLALFMAIILLSFVACANLNDSYSEIPNSQTFSDVPNSEAPSVTASPYQVEPTPLPSSPTVSTIEPFADVRGVFETVRLKPEEYVPEDIYTYWFNQDTFF